MAGWIISDYFNANSQNPSGAVINAYIATRFTAPTYPNGVPGQNAAPPGSPDAGPVETGPLDGGPGAFQIAVPTNDNYYVSIYFAGQLYWKLYTNIAAVTIAGLIGQPNGLAGTDSTGNVSFDQLGNVSTYPTLSNDGIFFNRSAGSIGNSEIFVMRSDGTGIQQITNNPLYQTWWAKVSPDGSRLAFLRAPEALTNYDSSYTQQSLWVSNIDGTNPVEILAKGWDGANTFIGVPNWTPDSRELICFSGITALLYLVRSDGTGSPVNIPVSGVFSGITDPSVSPDGTMIAFCYESNIWTVPIFGGTATQLTTGGTGTLPYTDPNFSFDNQTILFLSLLVLPDTDHPLGQWGLQTVQNDGTGQTMLLNDGNANSKGCWGEDGYIYFHRFYCGSPAGTDPDSAFSIAKIRSDGTGSVERLTNGTVRDYMPESRVSRFPRVPTKHAATHWLPTASDAFPWLTSIHGGGPTSARPAASFSNAGFYYFCTDTGTLTESNGATWIQVAPPTLSTPSIANLTAATSPNKPQDFGYLGWSNDPEGAGGAVQPVLGRLYLVRFRCMTSGTIGHVGYYCGVAGTSLTTNENLFGIFDTGQATAATATLLGTSSDQSTNLATAGPYSAALTAQSTGSLAVTAGQDYFFAMLLNGTGTIPKIMSAYGTTTPAFVNKGLAGVATRVGRDANTGLSGFPGTIGGGSIIATDASSYPYCFTAET